MTAVNFAVEIEVEEWSVSCQAPPSFSPDFSRTSRRASSLMTTGRLAARLAAMRRFSSSVGSGKSTIYAWPGTDLSMARRFLHNSANMALTPSGDFILPVFISAKVGEGCLRFRYSRTKNRPEGGGALRPEVSRP